MSTEEFDKDTLKELVSDYREAVSVEDKAIIATRGLDPDDFNEEVYEAAIAVAESRTEVKDYVEEFLEPVKALRTKYSELALELHQDA